MSGHSHFHNIAGQKAKTDAIKGKIFSRISKEITMVVKTAGKDPSTNPTLRTLISKAKAAQMPQDNITRAIKKGTGEIADNEVLSEGTFETIKSGVSLVVKTLSSNNNRTVAKINEVFKRNGLELAKQGSASRNFERLGIIYIKAREDASFEDTLLMDTLDCGADDASVQDGIAVVKCSPSSYDSVLENFKSKNAYDIIEEDSGVCLYPNIMIDVDGKTSESIDKLIDMLEELEDVQDVYDNRS